MSSDKCVVLVQSSTNRVAEDCLQHQVRKALGEGGDMVNALSGEDWIPRWETKVVMER